VYQQAIRDLKIKFEQIIQKLREDFATIRTGRASTGLVENVLVTYYGSTLPLKQMATLSTPDASQIIIQPWDKNALGDIELAIRNSDLNLSPTNDGNVVRVSLPPMTEERREELVRNIHRKGEEGRIALRSVRGEAWEKIKKLEKDGKVTEDDRYAAEKELNELIDDYNKKIEAQIVEKEKELRSI
jgi:ribosome recycling factor